MSNLWRVGNRLGRTLYLDDECVGMVDTPEIAARIVATMNGDASRIVPLRDADGTVDLRDAEDGHSHHYVPSSLLTYARAEIEAQRNKLLEMQSQYISTMHAQRDSDVVELRARFDKAYRLMEELQVQTRATATVREQWAAEMDRADRAEANLKMVSAGVDDVWRWQGDGQDHPESLASECPVVMSGETLRKLVASAETVAPKGMSMTKPNSVGEMRAQSAYQDGDTPIELVSEDPEVAAVLSELRIVKCYPDTVNSKGVWTSTFKIEVVKS